LIFPASLPPGYLVPAVLSLTSLPAFSFRESTEEIINKAIDSNLVEN